MTTKEIEQGLGAIREKLRQLEVAVDHMTVLLETQATSGAPSVKWASQIGVGKEVWQNVDVDAYIDAERNAWN